MKRSLFSVVLAVCLLCSFTSCATSYMPISKVPDAQELGNISATFETKEKIRIGVLGVMGIGLSGAGGYMIGASINSPERKKAAATGALVAGTGIGLAIIQDLVFNAPKRSRINKAAREALITAARQRYSEDIDVREIKVIYIQPSGRLHSYSATGIVIQN